MRLRHSIAFAVFCLLAGSRWLTDAAGPETLPPLVAQSLHEAVAGVVAFILLALPKNEVRKDVPRLLSIAAAGLLLLGPPVAMERIVPAIQPETRVALFAMAPVCVVVYVAMTNEPTRALLMPALAGFAGALLLLPWRLPSMGRETTAFGVVLAAVVLTAVGGVWTHTLIRGKPLLPCVAAIALANAVVIGLVAAVGRQRVTGFSGGDYAALLFDLAQMFLLVWLIAGIEPEQLASRFLLVPLVTIVQGAVVLRVSPDARMVVGILLLLFGAGALLRGKRETALSFNLRRRT